MIVSWAFTVAWVSSAITTRLLVGQTVEGCGLLPQRAASAVPRTSSLSSIRTATAPGCRTSAVAAIGAVLLAGDDDQTVLPVPHDYTSRVRRAACSVLQIKIPLSEVVRGQLNFLTGPFLFLAPDGRRKPMR